MPTLFYAAFHSATQTAEGTPLLEGKIAIGAGSLQSAAMPGASRVSRRVRIFCDSKAYVTWGTNPTAVNDGSDGRPMGSENPEYFDLEAGWKIAVIERT